MFLNIRTPNLSSLLDLVFNYKPFDDENGSLQIRGGTGLFTGTPPYVWISNQAGNNGVLFGDLNVRAVKDKNDNIISDGRPSLGFTGNMDTYKPAEGSATRSDIAITDPDFKYPSLWKSNIAADYKFGGWLGSYRRVAVLKRH